MAMVATVDMRTMTALVTFDVSSLLTANGVRAVVAPGNLSNMSSRRVAGDIAATPVAQTVTKAQMRSMAFSYTETSPSRVTSQTAKSYQTHKTMMHNA